MKIGEFFSGPKQYANSSTPKTPFDQAKEEWDRRDGHIVVQNYNLRRLLLLSWLVLLIISGGLVLQSLKSSVVPYIVEVDSTTGVVRNAGLAKAQVYTPQAAEMKYFLSQFIRNIRSLSLDPVVYKKNLEMAYGFLTKQAANKMNVQLQNENRLMFDERTINILAYNLETVLAEKIETVLSRSIANTRPRDFYDIYILHTVRKAECNPRVLKEALANTTERRGSRHVLQEYATILDAIQSSDTLRGFWQKYQKEFDYAQGITFDDTCNCIREIMKE